MRFGIFPDKDGWDGEWFLRAYDAYSQKIGSKECEEGQIFIEPQGFCVLAGVGIKEGLAQKALDSVKEKLDTDTVIEEIPKEKEEDEQKLKIVKRPELLNETSPLWTKHPNECTKEEYLEFYRKVFMDYKEPLFWIHLNMDYPFNLKGILYFPKINMEYESIEGTIKLYNNQVLSRITLKK